MSRILFATLALLIAAAPCMAEKDKRPAEPGASAKSDEDERLDPKDEVKVEGAGQKEGWFKEEAGPNEDKLFVDKSQLAQIKAILDAGRKPWVRYKRPDDPDAYYRLIDEIKKSTDTGGTVEVSGELPFKGTK